MKAGRDESVDVYGVAAALGGAALAAMETWYALSWREYLTPAALTARNAVCHSLHVGGGTRWCV